MPATLYLRPSPRAFFLISADHALLFRQPDANETKASRSVVVCEFLRSNEVDMRGMVRAGKGRSVEGVLGVTSVPSERSPIPEIFLLLVTTASTLSPLLPSSSLKPARVVSVEFHSLTSTYFDPPDLQSSSYGAYAEDDEGYDPYHTNSFASGSSTSLSKAGSEGIEHPCAGMKKYLESGGFFYAEGCRWDISTRMGPTNWIISQKNEGLSHPLESWDERFIWNASLLSPFLTFRSNLPNDVRHSLDEQNFFIPVIQGYVDSKPVSTGMYGGEDISSLSLISRLSWKRAGARFRTRGIDDDGQVANFVETEVILATESVTYSWVIVRGSVPLFWQQPSQGIGTLQGKVEITKPIQATQPAFDKHFMELLDQYHSVHAVNLLGQKDNEAMLSAAYSEHLQELKYTLENSPEKKPATSGDLDLTPYDFHAATRTNGPEAAKYDLGTRIRDMVNSRNKFGWTAIDTHSGQIIEQQQGVFRVNCLDCLDRTNYVQDVLSSLTLASFLTSIDSPLRESLSLWGAHRELWADNGDRLSKIYAGTGALNTSTTRTGKKTFAGMFSDVAKSVGRAYVNNFQDKDKQIAIDLLLGMMAGQRPVILFDPISDSVQSALKARIKEYAQTRPVSIYVGTFNLNGKKPDEDLSPWLFPKGSKESDIYMIAFQEIVELTAQQIVQTDPAKRRRWETAIMDTFAVKGKSDYLLYRSEQLVGTALLVIVRSTLTQHIRMVESATKKTGLQGFSGNKGGVGIRFNVFDTPICLMTCHLAAGHSNVSERNADYRTINTGLKFLRGKIIDDHDIVIWAADFNYRIGLSSEEVRSSVYTGNIDSLLAADQLLMAMDEREVFQGYEEGPISFLPTYKYDNGSDEYDTSEKQRIPAWTDRILYKGRNVKLRRYDRAELRISDHRPVYAILQAQVLEMDQKKKQHIRDEILKRIKSGQGLDKGETKGIEDVLEEKEDFIDLMSEHHNINSQSPRETATTQNNKMTSSGLVVKEKSGRVPPPVIPRKEAVTARNSSIPNRATPSSSRPSNIPILPPRPPVSLLDDDDSDSLIRPIIPIRSPTAPKLPERKPTLPPSLPTRNASPDTLRSSTPIKEQSKEAAPQPPPFLPSRRPPINSVNDVFEDDFNPLPPSNTHLTSSIKSRSENTSTSPANDDQRAPKGSVASARSMFEAKASETKPLTTRQVSSTKSIPRKPPLSSTANPISTTDPLGAIPISESPSVTPASTGDYLIVSQKSGTSLRQPNGTDLPPPKSPEASSSKRAPPPIALKPKNLRSTSGTSNLGS